MFPIRSARTAPTETYVEEFGRWFDEFKKGSYVYLQTENPGFALNDYNHHIWSISVEYRGSAIIYITTLAYFALGFGQTARFWACLGLFFYFQYIVDGAYYALFLMVRDWRWQDLPSSREPDVRLVRDIC